MAKVCSFIFFVFISSSFFTSANSSGVGDLKISIPSSETIDASYPRISDWVSDCSIALNDTSQKGPWAYCNSFLFSVIQEHFLTTHKKCPNVSVKDFLKFVDEEFIEYRNKNARPFISQVTGEVVPDAYEYRADVPTPEERPAFTVLKNVISKRCNLN